MKREKNSSPARSVLNSRFLVTDVNSEDSSASRAQVLPVQRISRNLIPSVPSTIVPSLLGLPCRAQLFLPILNSLNHLNPRNSYDPPYNISARIT
jgi:hypothetical protein